jgi:four helix bundle protein
MQDFHKLVVWKKAHQLTLDVYRSTATFPKTETYGLTDQVRRASASIAANIAEGCGRNSKGEMGRFLQIAAGSASEVEYHLLLARDLGYLAAADYEPLAQATIEIKRMLVALTRTVRGSVDNH